MWFKFAFMAAFGVALGVAAATARGAARRHGGALNQLPHEVPGLLAVRAALGLVFYAALIAWLVWPAALPWAYLPVPLVVRWAAVGLLVPALALFAWAFRTLGTNYRGGVGLYEHHTLVTVGPYRWIRHPIYAAFMLLMLILTGLSANWVLGLSGFLLVSGIAAIRIPIEETELHARFGDTWTAYRDRAGCLLPRIARRNPAR